MQIKLMAVREGSFLVDKSVKCHNMNTRLGQLVNIRKAGNWNFQYCIMNAFPVAGFSSYPPDKPFTQSSIYSSS